MIGKNYTEFATKVVDAVIEALNSTGTGREISGNLLAAKLKQNPRMTREEWDKTRQEFLTFCFLIAMKENPGLMQELSWHIWNELKNA